MLYKAHFSDFFKHLFFNLRDIAGFSRIRVICSSFFFNIQPFILFPSLVTHGYTKYSLEVKKSIKAFEKTSGFPSCSRQFHQL